MIEITKEMILELRNKSGLGVMDCKHALELYDGDMEKAMEYLRNNVGVTW